MDNRLLETCELFIENRSVLRETFKWEGEEMLLLGSALLTSSGTHADQVQLRNCERMIKDRTGRLSGLRWNLKMAAVCRMVLSDDPGRLLADAERAYNLIRISRGKRDERYYLAGLCMADAVSDKDELLDITDRANDLYDRLREAAGRRAAGPLADDSGYAAAAAIASNKDVSVDAVVREAAACAERLIPAFGDYGSTWLMALILALDSTDAVIKCARLKEITDSLEAAGIRFTPGDQMPVIAALARLDMTNADIAAAVTDADAFLRSQSGFGIRGTGAGRRRMYAAMMVLDTYMPGADTDAVLSSAILEGALEAQFRAAGGTERLV